MVTKPFVAVLFPVSNMLVDFHISCFTAQHCTTCSCGVVLPTPRDVGRNLVTCDYQAHWAGHHVASLSATACCQQTGDVRLQATDTGFGVQLVIIQLGWQHHRLVAVKGYVVLWDVISAVWQGFVCWASAKPLLCLLLVLEMSD
jgi:hypothetical protein